MNEKGEVQFVGIVLMVRWDRAFTRGDKPRAVTYKSSRRQLSLKSLHLPCTCCIQHNWTFRLGRMVLVSVHFPSIDCIRHVWCIELANWVGGVVGGRDATRMLLWTAIKSVNTSSPWANFTHASIPRRCVWYCCFAISRSFSVFLHLFDSAVSQSAGLMCFPSRVDFFGRVYLFDSAASQSAGLLVFSFTCLMLLFRNQPVVECFPSLVWCCCFAISRFLSAFLHIRCVGCVPFTNRRLKRFQDEQEHDGFCDYRQVSTNTHHQENHPTP